MRGVGRQQSLFSRHRASSVERELARTPYAFTPKPREADEQSDIITQRLIGPDILPGDLETIKKAREQILDPFEDDINVRLAKERIFGGYSKSGSRAPSPTIFPSNTDFEKKLKQDNVNYENVLFGPNVSFDTNSNYSEKLSDTSSIRTSNITSEKVKAIQPKQTVNLSNNNRVKQSVLHKSDSASDKSSNISVKTRHSSPVNKESINRRTSDLSVLVKDNKSDISSTSSASKVTVVKPKQVSIPRTFSFDRSASVDTLDCDPNKNVAVVNPISNIPPKVDEDEPAFKLRQFVHLKDNLGDNNYLKHVVLNVSQAGVEKYYQSRSLAEEYTERFYKSITNHAGSSQESRDSDDGRRFSDEPVVRPALPQSEPFKVLAAPQPPAADLESVSSTVSSYKVPPTAKPHRVTAFAILGDAVASASAAPPPSETESQESSVVPAVVPLPPNPTGRVSPFRGKGFKADSLSRHTTPRTSRATSRAASRAGSPVRSRANSLSKVEIGPKIDSRNPLVYERSQTPARNYIKENIEEVKELSEFNRERNQELAEQKRLEEEMEILKELGIIDPKELTRMAKTSLRSRSGSPSALLHYENMTVPNSRIINSRDGFEVFGRRPPKVSPRNFISLPQSKSGSPTHRSRIPKRRNSLTPPMDERDYYNEPSIMSNAISANGRFISNSTSSINDNRVFSIITDVDNKPIDINTAKVRSKSSSNLMPGPSILKSKPPKSPGKPGPPPSHKNLNSKRLSPIVSTPDKSPVPDESPPDEEQITTYQAKSFTQIKNGSQPSKISNVTNANQRSRGNVYEKATNRKMESKSKPGTPKVMSPTRIPNRTSKSLVTSPTTSRTPSRAPSRGPAGKAPGKDTAPLRKTPSVTRFSPGSKPSYSKNSNYSGKDDRTSNRSDSSETEKKYQLKRVNSRPSIVSKMGVASSGKPDLKRTDSRGSIKSVKPGTKRRPSMRDVEEMTEEPAGKGKSSTRSKPKKSTNRKETNTDDIDKQDSETQYDKTSHLEFNMQKLIPLTKTNVVSMTTAAITAQPLEIAAKVTSQLPSALEKARERGVFDRNSSSDSIAAKMAQQNEPNKPEEEKNGDINKSLGENMTLQKTASKTSIGSNKDEKNTLSRSDSIIVHNDMKLKLIKTPLDPKVEKVKMKIDNILNSSQSSFEDIREKIKKVEKATDKTNQSIEKTEEAEKKADESVKMIAAEIKNTEELITKADVKLGEVISDGAKKAEQIKTDMTTKVTDEIKQITNEAQKDISSVLTKKPSDNKVLTPVESTAIKPETPKPSEPKPTPSPAEVVKVKENVIKKETLTPTVTIVNEKARGKVPEEHVTEKIIKGDPDVEVQSGNIPMDKMMMHKSMEDTASVANGANGANGASTSNGKGKVLPPETNGSMESGAMENKGGVSMVSGPGMMGEEAGGDDEDGKKKKGCCGGRSIFPCCRSQNLSEVQLIDENIGKKRMSKSEKSQASGKKSIADMEEDKGCANRLICCRGKNKVRDSSLPRHSLAPSDATGRSMSRATVSTTKPQGRCASIFCCCCKKKDEMRRDSILSQKPKQKWYKRMLCCGKKNSSINASRRTSMFSKKRSLSQAVPLQEQDKRSKLDTTLIEHTSMLRGAIPALPVPLAWICLFCNVLVPGLGTVLSGMFCLCFGRPRFGIYDGWKPRIGAFLIDLIVGVGQLFTVLFCLVGWGWSIWWATIMIKVARKYKKMKTSSGDPEQAHAPVNHNRTNNNT